MDTGDLDVTRPFTRAELRGAGGDERLLRKPDYHQILERVWILKRAVDRDSLVRAALHIHPESAYASHLSAADVLGLPVPDHGFAHVTVGRHRDRRFRPRIKPHVTKRKRTIWVVRGMRVSDPIGTFIDCAGTLGLVDLAVLGDAIVKVYNISPDDLRKACAESTDYYAKRARIAAAFVRTGVDSPMETRLRMLIVLAGLPEPEVDIRVYNEDGTLRRRHDLGYRIIKLVIEYEGRQHAENVIQFTKDIDRYEEMDDEGYRALRVTARGIYQQPERTLMRVHKKLVELGHPDVRPINDRWREHFAA